MAWKIVAGFAVLLLGRQLFWLFVGVVGFAVGMNVAAQALSPAPDLLVFAIAVAAGVIGAVLAYFLQKLMIGVAGFLAGAQLAVAFAASFLSQNPGGAWIAAVAGGVIGAVLMLLLFDWALIFLSSVFGAHLIVQALPLSPAAVTILFLALTATGFVVQASRLRE